MVFVTDNEPAYLGDVFNNLGVFPEVDSLLVFGFEKDRNFNKIDNNFLARVNYHYPSNTYIDYDSADYKRFEKVYKKRFYGRPSSYSVEGFDITYDLLIRLTNEASIIDQGVSERISSQYDFIENTSGSLLNKGVFIIRYDGLKQEVLNSRKVKP